MIETDFYNLTKNDISLAAACLKDAFIEDPLWTEMFKDDPNKDNTLLDFFTCPVLHGIKYGKVISTSSDINSVASLLPRKFADMTTWRMLRSGAMTHAMKMNKTSIRHITSMSSQISKDRKQLMKNKNYQYLSVIGVASSEQSQGHGSKLLNVLKEACAKNNQYLYLETETERNVEFYEKHAFKVLKEITLDSLNLPMWEMVYKP